MSKKISGGQLPSESDEERGIMILSGDGLSYARLNLTCPPRRGSEFDPSMGIASRVSGEQDASKSVTTDDVRKVGKTQNRKLIGDSVSYFRSCCFIGCYPKRRG